ncbi:cysteine-rich CWC family protein [Trinickia acidisoli]|uniref:cysteine-rich CWC family protein n=1 Tax=Trinickia acidisoli TaxID=2767482 RepID=UPI001A8C1891|nr:cysteine-rich CWC family protein [Trinickia acidisoli]
MLPTDVRDPLVRAKSCPRCPRCGGAFDCGRMAQPFDCWCARMPALPKRPAAGEACSARCLCPACYADELAAGSRGAERDNPHS